MQTSSAHDATTQTNHAEPSSPQANPAKPLNPQTQISPKTQISSQSSPQAPSAQISPQASKSPSTQLDNLHASTMHSAQSPSITTSHANFPPPPRISYKFLFALGIFLFACALCIPPLATRWVRRTFGKDVDISQILFHLRFPVDAGGVDMGFVLSFCQYVLLPSVAIALIFACPVWLTRLALASLRYISMLILGISSVLYRAICRHSMLARFVILIALGAYGAYYTTQRLQIVAFIEKHKEQKHYGSFYEQYYVAPDIASLPRAQTPRNLLVIFMESMEASFLSTKSSDYSSHIATHSGLIPELARLMKQGISFDILSQSIGASWTMGGLISYNCAFPQTWLPFHADVNDNVARYFLHSATCLGDVLHALGYSQAFFRGANANFAGSKGFFSSHYIAMNDLASMEEWAQKHYYGGWRNDWGVKDVAVFDYVKAYLEGRITSNISQGAPQNTYSAQNTQNTHNINYAQNASNALNASNTHSASSMQKGALNEPFALFVLTADTHAPGFVDKVRCDVPTSYANALSCSSLVVSEFVQWFLRTPYASNTTLVLLGDHLTMQQGFMAQGARRGIYNVFINPSFSTPPSSHLTHNRLLTHFDIATLLLDAINIPTQAFGLGRNPLYGATLAEQLGLGELNNGLNQPSRIYEGFWAFNPNKK